MPLEIVSFIFVLRTKESSYVMGLLYPGACYGLVKINVFDLIASTFLS